MQTYYYKDELNDEFSSAQIKTKTIDGSYDYGYQGVGKGLLHVFWYKIIARPLAFCFLKIKFHHKIIGKEKIKKLNSKAFYLYGNHTNEIADAFIPTMLSYPKDAYVIVHPNNVSMPVLGRVTPYLGAMPLPGDREAMKNFMNILEMHSKENHAIMIYPEAHIWPYYTKIRPFTDASFRYPVMHDCPVICFTNTYQKRRFSKTPRIVTYVDGPFYADKSLNKKDAKKLLRDQVYEAMVSRSSNNNVEINRFIPMGEDPYSNRGKGRGNNS